MFATVSGATRAALDWAATNKVEIEMTGHPDRTMLAAAGVRFRDSRGGRRRGAGARARQRAKFDSVMAVRRAAKTAP